MTLYNYHLKMAACYRSYAIGRSGAIIPNSLRRTHAERKQINIAHARWHLEQAKTIRKTAR